MLHYVEQFSETNPPPRNHGKPWTIEDKTTLVDMLYSFKYGMPDIAKVLHRSTYAIECQVETLDRVGKEKFLGKVEAPVKVIQTKEKNVSKNHILSLLQKNYTTVAVSFASAPTKPYVYKAKLSLNLAVGDYCVVPRREGEGFAVATVLEVHPEPMINLESDFEYKWIVQKVDIHTFGYAEQVAKEEKFIQLIERVSRKKQETAMLLEFKSFLPQDEESQTIVNTAIQDLSAP